MNVDHFSLFLFCVVCSVGRVHLRRWAKGRLWRRRRRMKRQPWSSWQNRYDGRWEGWVRKSNRGVKAVTFNSTVRGAVIPEQHMPPCDSSSSIPACYLACLLLSCVWVCLNEQSDTHSAAFTRPVKHDISFTLPPLTSSSLHPLALYGTDKQGHILGV